MSPFPYSRFLTLPYDLRSIIYHYYVFEEDGYHFDYESGKLRASDDRPIDLALLYTCKFVAAEMYGLALKTNTLVFKTVYSEAERMKAGYFHWLVEAVDNEKNNVVDHTRFAMTSETRDMVNRKYPQFKLNSDDTLNFRTAYTKANARYWGETRSAYRGFIDYYLEVLQKYPLNYANITSNLRSTRYKDPTLFGQLLSLNPIPWAILSEDEVARLREIVQMDFRFVVDEDMWENINYRFSAAAMAIYFLQSTSHTVVLQMRKILIVEDNESVAYPECHAMGLIEFCEKNRLLHVERRANIWRDILPAGSDGYDEDQNSLDYVLHLGSIPTNNGDGSNHASQLHSMEVSPVFSLWIEEALALADAGMPAGSFSLFFDGDLIPDRSSEVFEVVLQDAAWQEAQDEWCKQTSFEPTFEDRRYFSCYLTERFPQAIKDIVEGNSFVSCNFPIGGLWSVEQVLYENRDIVEHIEWLRRWNRIHEAKHFDTAPPLPSWIEFRLAKVIRETDSPDYLGYTSSLYDQ